MDGAPVSIMSSNDNLRQLIDKYADSILHRIPLVLTHDASLGEALRTLSDFVTLHLHLEPSARLHGAFSMAELALTMLFFSHEQRIKTNTEEAAEKIQINREFLIASIDLCRQVWVPGVQ
jgi:hypothetical protein